jgi:hypothetical protein
MKSSSWVRCVRSLLRPAARKPRPGAGLGRRLEPLEDRVNPVLTVTAPAAGFQDLDGSALLFQPSPVPADIAATVREDLWSLAGEVGGVIADTGADLLSRVGRLAALPLVDGGRAEVSPAGAVEVYVHLDRWDPDVRAAAEQAGPVAVVTANAEMKVVQGWVAADRVDEVGRVPGVREVSLPGYAVTNAGSVATEGDAGHLANMVRGQFAKYGIDGTGVKVGVISDGATNRSLVTGFPNFDLPTVTVDPSRPGNGNEGTAMLEIVHDLAPGAQLFFSGPATNLQMVDSINWLVGQGCNVIVDDLTFFFEGFFQDTGIANAARNAVNNGVVYVTSAGNLASPGFGSNRYHYQGMYQTTDGDVFHDYVAGDEASNISIAPGKNVTVVLQWSDPFGATGNNYDVHLYAPDLKTILAQDTFVENGNDNPTAGFTYTNNGGSTVNAFVVVSRVSGAARELELLTWSSGPSALQFYTREDSLIGHEAVPEVIAVGSVNAGDLGLDDIASYSSRGQSTIYTNFAAQTKELRTVLDGAGIDGTQTKIGQLGFFSNPFFGTSAAAPHVAGIAALMRQVNPSISPLGISSGLALTATDLTAYGKGYDPVSGAGLYNALDAVYYWFVPSPPDLTAASDDGLSDTDNVTTVTAPTFQGAAPAGSYVRLFAFDGFTSKEVGATQLGLAENNYTLTTSPLAIGKYDFRVIVSSSAKVPSFLGSLPSGSLTVQIVSPFVVTGDTLTVIGTAKDDVFTFQAGTPHKVTLNGTPFEAPAGVTKIAFLGQGGFDTGDLTGVPGTLTDIVAGPGYAEMIGPGYKLNVYSTEAVKAKGVGEDYLSVFDSPGNDVYTGTPAFSQITGPGLSVLGTGFDKIAVYAKEGGLDRAELFDSAGNDAFVGTTAYGHLAGPGFSLVAAGFDEVRATATGGLDGAYVYDSAGNDAFVGTTTYGHLAGAGFSNLVIGFDDVRATASGGVDGAYLYDSPGNDAFVGTPAYSYLAGAGFAHTAFGFDDVRATASGGVDGAYLYDSPGNDTFVGGPAVSYLAGAGFATVATGFDDVRATASAGVDAANLSDSAGNDAFVGTPAYSYLAGAGFANTATGFDSVIGTASAGSDAADLYDAIGNDGFYATPELAQLTGAGFFNRVVGFDLVTATASGGVDGAYLYDSAGNDGFYATPSFAQLAGAGFVNRAVGFDDVRAFASAGVDGAYLYDSPGADVFYGTPAYGYLAGAGFVNVATGFDDVRASASAGADTAYLYDSPGNDQFFGAGADGTLLGVGYSFTASLFEDVALHGTAGGVNRLTLNPLTYRLHRFGSWV